MMVIYYSIFDRKKYELYGVEPAKNVAKIAKKKELKYLITTLI